MIRFALVGDHKEPPFRAGRGTCPVCAGRVIAKCGRVRIHHWAHESAMDCDTWSEGIGPWHLSWQDLVQREFVEVPIGNHRADILGNDGIVVELQHSPIPPDVIALRENFYGNMIWVFDASRRFSGIASGERYFFSVGRNRHIHPCTRPVFLDYGEFLVQVGAMTAGLGKLSGFGVVRDRRWFVEKYLSQRCRASPEPALPGGDCHRPWPGKQPWRLTEHPSDWQCPAKQVPEKSVCVPLDYRCTQSTEPAWLTVIRRFPQVANGWTEADLLEMMQFLDGTPMIMDGCLRLMPGRTEQIIVRGGLESVRQLLDQASIHVEAGRLPVITPATRSYLLEKAKLREVGKGHYLAGR